MHLGRLASPVRRVGAPAGAREVEGQRDSGRRRHVYPDTVVVVPFVANRCDAHLHIEYKADANCGVRCAPAAYLPVVFANDDACSGLDAAAKDPTSDAAMQQLAESYSKLTPCGSLARRSAAASWCWSE